MKENSISERIKESIIGYYSGDLNQQQAEELVNWLSDDTENIQLFNEIKEIWQASALISNREFNPDAAFLNLHDKIRTRNIRPLPPRKISITLTFLYRVAAGILLVSLLGAGALMVLKKPNSKILSETYFEAHAPKGSKTLITLSEGTQVWLNAGTTLRYSNTFNSKNRDVYLEGEAFFRVSKNKHLPFKVSTSDICITALGTAFNVKSYSEESLIETTLEEGSLRIDPLISNGKSKKSSPIYLKQNQKLIYQKQDRNLAITSLKDQVLEEDDIVVEKHKDLPVRISTVQDIRLYTSWKDSQWVFKNEKLSTLAPKLERRYDINIIFEDSTLLDYSFSGTLRDESVEQVLAAIRFTAPIRFEINYKQVTLQVDDQLKEQYFNLLEP